MKAEAERNEFYVRIDDDGDAKWKVFAENVDVKDTRPAGMTEFMANCKPCLAGKAKGGSKPLAHLSTTRIRDIVQLRATMSLYNWQKFLLSALKLFRVS